MTLLLRGRRGIAPGARGPWLIVAALLLMVVVVAVT